MSSPAARGRGKIRAPRRALTKDDVDFDAIWAVLEKAFGDIHHKNASQLSFEELFRNAYKLVLKKRGDELYEKVVRLEEDWLRRDVMPRIAALASSSVVHGVETTQTSLSSERKVAGERFLEAIKDAFQDHQLCMGMITDVLMYMDRINSQSSQKPSIYAEAMALFRMTVLRAPYCDNLLVDILSLVETIILDMIEMERNSEIIDRALIRASCAVLEGLYTSISEEESTKLYLTSFEPKFLEASRKFYREEGRLLLQEADASTFCTHAQKRLKEEDQRCKQTISQVSREKVIAVLEQELISAHIRDVINLEGTGVKNMLENDRVRDVGNVYDLIARVDPKKVALKEAVQKQVFAIGAEINKSTNEVALEKPVKPTGKTGKSDGEKAPAEKALNQQTVAAIMWVEEVLGLKAKFDALWKVAFRRDKVMEKGLEISFQDFINANHRSPEHLSLFFDEYLKKGGKSKTEQETDAILDNGITLLQFLGDKDLFEHYYKKHMAKRLLLKKSISRDVERQILSKMKVKLGNQFTQKMEGLIKDMELSESLNSQYREYVSKLGDADPNRVDVEGSVLTTTVWPINTLFKADEQEANQQRCKFPEVVEHAKHRYEKFYLDKHTGRKLTWLPNMGTADLRATFKGSSGKARRYEVNVSTYGMVVLMLFNQVAPGESLTFEEIAAETNIPEIDLIRNLQSLCLSQKWRMLKKEPMSKDIKPSDRFFFNEDYTSQFLKIKVSVVSQTSNRVENAEERRETQKRADEERGHAIDAAIVRIMKSRKTLSHQQLMSETLAQLSTRFQPDVNMVKKKIESLIDRDYLERGSDANSYNYLA